MFDIEPIKECNIWKIYEGGKLGIRIIFKKSEKNTIYSFDYYDVSDEKVQRLKEVLDDYTKTNKECTNVCSMIPLITFLSTINRILFDE